MDRTAPRIEVRPLGTDQADAVRDIDQWAFAIDLESVDSGPAMACLEWDRTYGGYLDTGDGPAALAGVTSTYSFELPVPGASVACGGLTWVGVHPQYRRRGVMTALLRHHLAAVRERGEPVSALHSAEPAIYGRFGYGIASRHLRMTVPSGTRMTETPGASDVRLSMARVDVDRHADVVGDCFEAARLDRPGMVSRNTPAHRRAALDDQPARREGFESLRLLLAESAGDGPARGYALFRRKEVWTSAGTAGVARVQEFVARDAAAAAAMWRTLLDLDLMRQVEVDDRPTDDPLLTWLVDARSIAPTLSDGLWVRLVDVPQALASRRYSRDIDVVLEVQDAACPWNSSRWRLSASGAAVTCVATAANPDVVIDVRELSAAYLGSTNLMALRSAGLVDVPDDDVAIDVATAFSWPVAAYCGRIF